MIAAFQERPLFLNRETRMPRRAGGPLKCMAVVLFAAASGAWAQDVASSGVAAGPVADEPPPTARAQAIEPLAAREPWRFAFTPYFWLFAMDGSIKKNGIKLDVSTNLHDTVDLVKDHGDIIFTGHLEAFRGDWSFFIDGTYAGFSDDSRASRSIRNGIGSASAETDWNMHLWLVEFGAARKVAEISICDRKAPLDVIGGGRWNHLDFDADIDLASAGAAGTFEREFSPNMSNDWVDPFIGLRTELPIAEHATLLLRGDVGGGFGNGSDFAWNVVVGVTVRLNTCVDLFAGYRWYDFERDVSGRDAHMQLHGPGLGVTIRF